MRLLCPRDTPRPSPGDLPAPGIEPASLMSLALAGRFFTISATWEAHSGLCGDLNGTEIQKEGIYVYVQLIHFAAEQKLTRHCESTTLQ